MSKPIAVGVIGIGYGQHVHVPAFRRDERCQVVGICASSAERASAVAARLGIARAYGEWPEIVADPEIDAISVAVPPALQVRIVQAAASAGKHVFCEKPLAGTLEEAREMLRAVERAHVVHAVDFIFPEIGAWKTARQILGEGELGALRQVYLTWRVETHAARSQHDSWKLSRDAGGGTLNNFVSHSFYYLEWLFGAIERVAARLSPAGGAGDLRVDAWLDFAGGLPCTLSVAADAFLGSGHRLEVYGEQGTLVLENRSANHASGFLLLAGTRESGLLTGILTEGHGGSRSDGRIEATSAIVRRFLDAITTNTSGSPNLEAGVRVQELIDATRSADATGSWQRV